MTKKIAYILTRFPMVSETFIYHELRNLIQQECPIDIIIALRKKHNQVGYDLSSFNIIYPPSLYSVLACFIAFSIMHPVTIVRLIGYLASIHRGDFIHLKKGYTSFIKGFFLLPLIIWINQQLGSTRIHFHAHFPAMATTAAMLLAKLRNTTFSFTGHGTDVLEYAPKGLSYRINASRFFITVSDYNKQFIIKKYKNVNIYKIHVIPAVVDTERFKAIRTSPGYEKPEIVRFITVARLSPEKGHEVFLNALARFSRMHNDFHYTVIGDGELGDFLKERVRTLGIAEKVSFHGYCNPDCVLNALQESNLFVLTSYNEGLPVALMEAAAAGLPILATRITAIPEIVHHSENGILVEPGNEDSIYQGLIALADNNWEQLLQISHNAANQDIRDFDIRNTIPAIKHLLLGCLD